MSNSNGNNTNNDNNTNDNVVKVVKVKIVKLIFKINCKIIPAKNPNSKVNNQMCVARSYEFHKGPLVTLAIIVVTSLLHHFDIITVY